MREDADKQSSERVDGSDLIGQHGAPCLVTVQQEHVACNEHYSLLTAVRYYNYTVTHYYYYYYYYYYYSTQLKFMKTGSSIAEHTHSGVGTGVQAVQYTGTPELLGPPSNGATEKF